MDAFGDMSTYIWHRLPLILLFGGGYLVYQLMAATRLTSSFVSWVLQKSRGGSGRLVFYIICATAMLSSFIPNTIAVLTLLPVLQKLDREYSRQGVSGMTTPLMCAAIYGAAIGGMGSMIGSPANAILFGALDVFEVPGRNGVTFFNWFLWSIPLSLMFIVAAWGVVALLGLPASVRGVNIKMECLARGCQTTRRQRYGATLFWLYMGFWIGEAFLREASTEFAAVSPVVCLIFTAVFLYLSFVRQAPDDGHITGPLLKVRDMLNGIPRRGLMFILILAALFTVVHWLGLDEKTMVVVGRMLQGDMPELLLFFLTILCVVFLTEILSNTAVVAAFFAIAFYAATGHEMNPLYIMIGVSVASTCAFMTPIATPTNALAFGEMRGASLRVMVGLGFVLNLVGACLLTLWLSTVLPIVY